MKFKMPKIKLPPKVATMMAKTGFKLQKHSPEILIGLGIVGTVTSVVLACRATVKAEDVLKEHQDHINTINTALSMYKGEGVYTEEDAKKETFTTYLTTIFKVARLYLPAASILTISLTSILVSHNIMTKRNASLAMAATAISQSFDEYRARVADKIGEEAEKELRYDIHKEKVETEITDENGKTKKVKDVVKTTGGNITSPYARIFDELNSNYDKDPEINLMFIRRCERYANDKLRVDGFLFLNQVYDMLGFEPSKIGQTIGWIYDPDNKDAHNYVDFGLYETCRSSARNFVNGLEPAVILDFNVDGNIIHKAKFSREV